MGNGVRKFALFCLGLAVFQPGVVRAQEAGDAHKVLEQINAASAKFQSAQADFSWDQLQTVVSAHVIHTATVYYERKKGATHVPAYIQKENGKDAPKTLTYNGSEADFYVPSINQ